MSKEHHSSPSDLPETWPGLIWSALKEPRKAALLLAFLLIGSAGYVFRNRVGEWVASASSSKTCSHEDTGLKECIDNAQKHNKPYIIQACTVFVKLQDDSNGEPRERVADVRIVYTLLPLRKITKDMAVFKESFFSQSAMHMLHWNGSHKEILDEYGNSSAYEVQFSAEPWQQLTIVTGVRYRYKLPFDAHRMVFFEKLRLEENEDTYIYPNDEDFIRELTIIIESDSCDIQQVGQGAKRSCSEKLQSEDAFLNTRKNMTERTLSARWENLLPRESVGIHYRW